MPRLPLSALITTGAFAAALSGGCAGSDGEPCTVEQSASGGAVITCPDQPPVSVDDGEDGHGSLVRIDEVPLLDDCPVAYGVHTGVDLDDSGALDAGEIESTVYLCSDEIRSVVYFSNNSQTTDQIVPALHALDAAGMIDLTVAETDKALVADLEQHPDVVIYFNVTAAPSGEHVAALSDWVGEGGRLILSDWTRQASLLATLDAEAGAMIDSTTASISDARIGQGIGASLAFANQGWADSFTWGLTPVDGGVEAATFGSGEACVVLGNEERTAALGFYNDAVTPEAGAALIKNLLRVVLRAP